MAGVVKFLLPLIVLHLLNHSSSFYYRNITLDGCLVGPEPGIVCSRILDKIKEGKLVLPLKYFLNVKAMQEIQILQKMSIMSMLVFGINFQKLQKHWNFSSPKCLVRKEYNIWQNLMVVK